uniref:Beta-1,3-galactosyl-O-glycosyl-glycoprotein beta-1,6-N-acetylglucosaminyltransferase 3 n=1 Tax=Steinernema glaseri TaxID=37863 RepID=A0A1I8A4F7_9BILA
MDKSPKIVLRVLDKALACFFYLVHLAAMSRKFWRLARYVFLCVHFGIVYVVFTRKIGVKQPLPEKGDTVTVRYQFPTVARNSSLDKILGGLPAYREMVNCKGIVNNDYEAVRSAKKWTYNSSNVWDSIYGARDRCEMISSTFGFAKEPLSEEEENFPLAYGMVLYSNSVQVLYMLSAIFQPQNQFCLAIDSKASSEFKKRMQTIANCFPNIHILHVPTVDWCGFNVLRAVYSCVEHLASIKSKWKYYQYLAGSDLPLKTNLEMVRIFKALKGSFNSVVADFQTYRANAAVKSSPLQPWKSSLSATFSRESAVFMVQQKKTAELLMFLQRTECSDESFWTTLAGNVKEFPMPGGFDASMVRSKLEQIFGTVAYVRGQRDFGLYQPEKYYISRFQVCLDYQPATFFCVYEAVRRRAFDPNDDFDARNYATLAGPQMMEGRSPRFLKIKSPTGNYATLAGPQMVEGRSPRFLKIKSPTGLDFF